MYTIMEANYANGISSIIIIAARMSAPPAKEIICGKKIHFSIPN